MRAFLVRRVLLLFALIYCAKRCVARIESYFPKALTRGAAMLYSISRSPSAAL